MMKKILTTTSNFNVQDNPSLQRLMAEGYTVISNPHKRRLSEDELCTFLQEHNPVGVVAGVEPWTQKAFESAPDLKALSRCGAGMDNVDHDAAKAAKVIVSNTPAAPSLAVAELTLGLMLSALRHISMSDRNMRNGIWEAIKGNTLHGKTIGVIGYGYIGRKVAELCAAFGADVQIYDPYADKTAPYKKVDHNTVFTTSDIITLHVPLTDETQYMVSDNALKTMKANTIIINAARGGLIDERALYNALKEKQIAGAALDVFENEPYTGPLRDLDNVVLTAHMGSYAIETRAIMEYEAAENLINTL